MTKKKKRSKETMALAIGIMAGAILADSGIFEKLFEALKECTNTDTSTESKKP